MNSDNNEDQGLLGSGAFWFGALLFFYFRARSGY